MNHEEIQQAINETKAEIYQLKEQLARVTDLREEKKLLAKIKELQIKQLWHLDQLKAW